MDEWGPNHPLSCPRSPIGRGNELKIHVLWVRLPPRVPSLISFFFMVSSLLDTPSRIQETSWIYNDKELLEQPQGCVGFVYLITNLINEKSKDTNKELKYRYIGMKTFDGGKPYNDYYGSQKELNDDVEKYGKENFKREILCFYETIEELVVKEIEEQTKRNVLKPGSGYYNRTIAYRKFNYIGLKHSDETRMKMSESKTGENHPLWGKTGENNPNYGKSPSEETKMKMSEAQKGENHPMWGKTGENNPNYGKTHSEESKMKISEAQKGENSSMWGKTLSDETRMKMSESKKGENSSSAKLNEKQVFQILFLRFYRKVQQKQIAEAFNIARNSVSFICTRRRWIDQYDAFFEMEPYKHLKPQR